MALGTWVLVKMCRFDAANYSYVHHLCPSISRTGSRMMTLESGHRKAAGTFESILISSAATRLLIGREKGFKKMCLDP